MSGLKELDWFKNKNQRLDGNQYVSCLAFVEHKCCFCRNYICWNLMELYIAAVRSGLVGFCLKIPSFVAKKRYWKMSGPFINIIRLWSHKGSWKMFQQLLEFPVFVLVAQHICATCYIFSKVDMNMKQTNLMYQSLAELQCHSFYGLGSLTNVN